MIEGEKAAPINSRLNVVVRSPTPFELGRNGCWPSRQFSHPGDTPSFFRYAALWTTAVGQHTASSKSVACYLFLVSIALVFPFFVSAFFFFSWWAVMFIPTLAPSFLALCVLEMWPGGASHKWVHLRCSQLSFSIFRALGSSHSWSCPPCSNTVTPFPDSSDMYTSTVQSGPASANAALSPHPRLQTSYPPSAHYIYLLPLTHHYCPLLLVFLLCLLPLLPLTLSGFFNGMQEVFEPRTLNYFTFSRPILLTLSAFRNPILTPLPFSGFLDSLLCVLIVSTSCLAFSLLIPRALAAASSFFSGRAYSFLNFQPPLFLRSIPTLIMWGSTSL